MIEGSITKKWIMRGLYVLLCLSVIFLEILPLTTQPQSWAGPDWIFALTFAWAGRRPTYVPSILVAAVLLLSDFIFYRPPGLWSVFVLLSIVYKKNQIATPRDSSFLSDYLNFALVLVIVNLGYRLALVLFFVDRTPLVLTLTQIITTLLAYPVVVALSYYVFGIRPLRPRDNVYHRGLI